MATDTKLNLTKLDLDKSVEPDSYKEKADSLKLELQQLHRQIYEARIPVLLLFEGWEGAGKGDCVNRLLERMDPRGTRVYSFAEPSDEEKYRPFFWRYWLDIPSRGQVAVFQHSYYHWLLRERFKNGLKDKRWAAGLEAFRQFERMLADDGVLVLKFWLHIGRGEQRKRFKKWEKDPAFAFRVSKDAWAENDLYDERLAAAEEMLAATHERHAPWITVEATDRRYRRLRVVEEVVGSFRRALQKKAPEETKPGPDGAGKPLPMGAGGGTPSPATPGSGRVTKGPDPLAALDLSKRLDSGIYAESLDNFVDELRVLQHLCYTKRLPVMIVFEGSDASGKGGSIRRLTSALDPRGYNVIPIAAPEGEEKHKHYLWRFWRHVPKAGHWAIYDRSWYGRVLVERVEGFCRPADWRRAYAEIKEFERQLVRSGIVLVKFWLQVSPDEQLRRFKEREQTPEKRYKITPEDWRNREKRPQYEAAVADMVVETSTEDSPWTLVESDDKLCSRIKVLQTVAKAVRNKVRKTEGWKEGLLLP
ncbi:MAG: polyphosphate:AMP phosphotransferase [Elusimicrobia bacterium]|nr:polyphosphate:AMP phosphotransferase [Elusimicrobiota bacterium]